MENSSDAEPVSVLYIEDDRGEARLMQRHLGRAGFAVTVAHSASDGLELLEAQRPAVILLDHNLPDKNGLQVLHDLRARHSGSPAVIYVTGFGDERVAVEAMKLGAHEYLIKDPDGLYLELIVPLLHKALQDIEVKQQNRKSQLELEESEARFRTLFQNAPEALVILDADTGRFVDANDNAKELFGLSMTELLDTGPADVSPLVQPDGEHSDLAAKAYVDRALAGEVPTFEWVHRHVSGRLVDCEVRLARLQSHGRHLVRGSMVDITDRKHMERMLHAEKERAQVTLHSIGDAVIATDAEGLVDYMNPVAEEMTGWKLSDAVGQPLANVFHIVKDGTREPAVDPVTRCIAEGAIVGLANHTVLISRNGREYAIQDSAAPIRGSDGAILGVVLVFNDVTEARRLALQMSHDASHDPLTGLVNRREFEQRLERAWLSNRRQGIPYVLCYMDLDQFKVVNDTAGHMAGDEVLKQISGLLATKLRTRDTLARLGGDEFALLLENCPLGKAKQIAESIVANVSGFRFLWEDCPFTLGISIGMVPFTDDAETSSELLSRSDIACYTAKEQGRNCVHVYEGADSEPAKFHGEILRVTDLRDALDRGRFELFSQPIFALQNGDRQPYAEEILIRLRDDKGKLILPGAFIPAAERYGLMSAIDRYVIAKTMSAAADAWGDSSHLAMAINLSGTSLNDTEIKHYVDEMMRRYEIPPESVCFEITETAAISHLSNCMAIMKFLKARGCNFALDDFGSGLSSFTYLKNLPVDYLKIDATFASGMVQDDTDRVMVEAINQVGHKMGIKTIAEGVEDMRCIKALTELGVDYAQGHALARPGSFPVNGD